MKRLLIIVPVFFLGALATVVGLRKARPERSEAVTKSSVLPRVSPKTQKRNHKPPRGKRVTYRKTQAPKTEARDLGPREKGRALHAGTIRTLIQTAVSARLRGDEPTVDAITVSLRRNRSLALELVNARIADAVESRTEEALVEIRRELQ